MTPHIAHQALFGATLCAAIMSDAANDARPKAFGDLSGKWSLAMGKSRWTVRLAPRSGLPGEYLGVGEREARDADGKLVTMDIGAVVKDGDLWAWLGPAIVKCQGRYRDDGPVDGSCTQMPADPAGTFHAERVRAAR
jgi:hypothetical protein